MRRLMLMTVASVAVLALAPASALARHHHHHRGHARVHHTRHLRFGDISSPSTTTTTAPTTPGSPPSSDCIVWLIVDSHSISVSGVTVPETVLPSFSLITTVVPLEDGSIVPIESDGGDPGVVGAVVVVVEGLLMSPKRRCRVW